MTALADTLFNDAGLPLEEEFFGTSIVYYRRSEATTAFTAIAETVSYTVIDAEGSTTTVTARDYTVPVASLVIAGAQVDPIKGDRIKETINGIEHTYELLPLGTTPTAELLPGGFRWLLHTKRVS
jgi:hypothetical protein